MQAMLIPSHKVKILRPLKEGGQARVFLGLYGQNEVAVKLLKNVVDSRIYVGHVIVSIN